MDGTDYALWYEVGKTEMREREGRDRKRVLVLVARKACKREVVSVPDQDPNRGRGREEGWKARQKESARATPTTSPQRSQCRSSTMGIVRQVEMIDHACNAR